MIIVMTGATGLVGSALGQRLVRDGHEVRILVRDLSRAHPPYPCQKFLWAGDESPAPQAAFLGATAVIHLAGENIAAQRWSAERKRALRDSRIKGLEGLKRGLVAAGVTPQIFVSASATGVYGDCADSWLDEGSIAGNDFLAQLCQEWESNASAIPAQRRAILRLGVVLSVQGGFIAQVMPLFQMLGASSLGSGQQWMPWVHIDDVVEGFVEVLSNARMEGIYNLVAPTPARNREVTEQMARQLSTFKAPAVPSLALKALYGELSDALLGSQRVKPRRLEEAGFKWRFPALESALQDLLGDLERGEIKLVYETWIPRPKEEIWPFFSSETNLERLTPPFLNFRVVGKNTPNIQRGTLIDYRLSLHGIPISWRTQINEWVENQRFVDNQLRGPYKRWHHLHEFESFAGGTLMRDTIHLKGPLGWLGRLVSLPMVLKDVRQIFAYRAQVIEEIFSSPGT